MHPPKPSRRINSPPYKFCRRSDGILRWKMLWAAGASIVLNLSVYYILFHMALLHPLLNWMKQYAYFEDRLAIITFTALLTIVFLLVLYTLKVTSLVNDIKHLNRERERERDLSQQRQKLEALGLITSGISHEINSSLQTVLGSCEMARNRVKDPTACLGFIQRAIDNSLHARRVINNVLTFSSTGGQPQLDIFNLGELMSEAVQYTKAFIAPQVKITVWHARRNFMVVVDRVGFVQVISNLISNAAQAMENEGTVKIECDTHTILPQATALAGVPAGVYARIKLTDTGKGIEPVNIKKNFDPFFTTKNIGEGTGLGLSIVHGLVKSMKGSVYVTSKLNIGTVFTVLLPVSESKPS